MKGDAKVIDYLNAGLRSELTAVSQYWLHYRLQEDWGFGHLAAEHDARTLYIEARQHCDKVGDYVTRALFDELLADEEGHIDFLETQLGLFDKLGAERYGLLNAKPANKAE